MVSKDLEIILSNETTRKGFFNNPKFYFGKSNWKKLDDLGHHISWQNVRTGDIVAVTKIITDMIHKYYVWRVNKDYIGGNRKTDFTTKKQAIDFAAHYRKVHQ